MAHCCEKKSLEFQGTEMFFGVFKSLIPMLRVIFKAGKVKLFSGFFEWEGIRGVKMSRNVFIGGFSSQQFGFLLGRSKWGRKHKVEYQKYNV